MTRLFIVRHGQTAWNKEKVFRGRVDIPLNEQGFKEAEAVAEALKHEKIAFIYSSPLSRAVQTAQPTAKMNGVEIVKLDGITDMNFGVWEGRRLEDVEKEDTDRYRLWVEKPHELAIPNGETLTQVQTRALNAVKEIVGKHPTDSVMLVSHRVVCKLLVLGLMGLGPDKFWNIQQDTACINLFTIKDGRTIMFKTNDTCHLASLKSGMVTADF
jgi:broad specificity phosphatase PhoE